MNKPETRFIQTVHRKLQKLTPPPLIRKIADRFTQGWPDTLYIGPTGIQLWIEYKVHPNQPTALQWETLRMLQTYQQNVGIITKTSTNCAIFDGHNTTHTNEPWVWITQQLGYSPHATTQTRREERS